MFSTNILDCSDCGKPWPPATRETHTRCYCDLCTQIRLNDRRQTLTFAHDEQDLLALDAQPEEAAA